MKIRMPQGNRERVLCKISLSALSYGPEKGDYLVVYVIFEFCFPSLVIYLGSLNCQGYLVSIWSFESLPSMLVEKSAKSVCRRIILINDIFLRSFCVKLFIFSILYEYLAAALICNLPCCALGIK